MKTISAYLNCLENTEEAFNFYKSVFGGAFTAFRRFGETPESARLSQGDQEKILHVALPVGLDLLMVSDALQSKGDRLIIGNNIYLSMLADSQEEADRLFSGLSAGGKVIMPMDKTFWGAYLGILTDPFGVRWMVSYNHNARNQRLLEQ